MNYGPRGCVGKFSFDTAAHAKKIARQRRMKNDSLSRQVAYKCRSCPYWHIGEQSLEARRIDDDRPQRRYGLKRLVEDTDA